MTAEPARWQMHAGRDTHHGGFKNFGHRMYVRAYGHTEVVDVEVIEDPDGPYWGWIWVEDGEEKPPTMIQQHEGLYTMQFPYGPAAEERAGKGRTVRLRAVEIPTV